MRKLVILLATFATMQLFAQESRIPVNDKTGLAEYTGVVEVAGASQSELYSRANRWIFDYFNNPHQVIREKDSVNYVVEGQAQFRITAVDKKGTEFPAGIVVYNFRLEFRDGRFKYTIYKIRWKKSSYYDVSNWEKTDDVDYNKDRYPQYVDQTVNFIEQLLKDMAEGISTADEDVQEDW